MPEDFPHIIKRWDHCPVSKTCSAKRVFESDKGEYYTGDTSGMTGMYRPHMCRGTLSILPEKAYVGVWYNNLTSRTRYIGPERKRSSAETAPSAAASRKSARHKDLKDDWVLQKTLIADLVWRDAKEDE